MTVVIVYLLYTIYEADYWIRQQGDFYQDLGLSPGVDGKTIKSKFRRLQVPSKTLLSRPELTFFRAAIHHPDKRASSEDSASAEARFVELKIAQDTLVDPVRRWAYERFGPDMLKWQHCSSIRDYLLVGLQVAVPMYAGSVIFMTILGVTGYLQWGRFVRYLSHFYKTTKLTISLPSVALPDLHRSLPPRIPYSDPPLRSSYPYNRHKSHPPISNHSRPHPPLPAPCARAQINSYALHGPLPDWCSFPLTSYLSHLLFSSRPTAAQPPGTALHSERGRSE